MDLCLCAYGHLTAKQWLCFSLHQLHQPHHTTFDVQLRSTDIRVWFIQCCFPKSVVHPETIPESGLLYKSDTSNDMHWLIWVDVWLMFGGNPPCQPSSHLLFKESKFVVFTHVVLLKKGFGKGKRSHCDPFLRLWWALTIKPSCLWSRWREKDREIGLFVCMNCISALSSVHWLHTNFFISSSPWPSASALPVLSTGAMFRSYT